MIRLIKNQARGLLLQCSQSISFLWIVGSDLRRAIMRTSVSAKETSYSLYKNLLCCTKGLFFPNELSDAHRVPPSGRLGGLCHLCPLPHPAEKGKFWYGRQSIHSKSQSLYRELKTHFIHVMRKKMER